jgi:hypothetical protein
MHKQVGCKSGRAHTRELFPIRSFPNFTELRQRRPDARHVASLKNAIHSEKLTPITRYL